MPMRHIKPQALALIVATLATTLLNVPFWRQLIQDVNPATTYEWLFLVSVFILATVVYTVVLSAFAFCNLLKPLAVILLLLTAFTGHFISEYGTAIDASMLRNLLETDLAEAYEFATLKLFLHISGMGVLPAILICLVPVAWGSPKKTMLASGVMTLVGTLVAIVVVAPFVMNYVSVFREHKRLRLIFSPYNVFAAAERLSRHRVGDTSAMTVPFGIDARQRHTVVGVRSIVVLVVGETARAANFSLNGYGRNTNPALASRSGVISFTNVTSCGTSTAESLPCIFSGLGRKQRNNKSHLHKEGLLDILQRAGIAVLWRDNQSGCKGVCARVPTEQLRRPTLVVDGGEESHDEVLLDGLEERIATATGDSVIVLHMMGSHGPAYYKRYPTAFEVFKPACKSSQFSRCSPETIVNAYDNTIAYTDHVLSRLIDILKKSDERGIASSMLYVSDHGESLGENGLYLHGLPFAIAPTEQKHVPLLLWQSPIVKKIDGIPHECIDRGRDRPLSHDHIFHTLLGMTRVNTTVYDPHLDILTDCRNLLHATSTQSTPR